MALKGMIPSTDGKGYVGTENNRWKEVNAVSGNFTSATVETPTDTDDSKTVVNMEYVRKAMIRAMFL